MSFLTNIVIINVFWTYQLRKRGRKFQKKHFPAPTVDTDQLHVRNATQCQGEGGGGGGLGIEWPEPGFIYFQASKSRF